MSNKKKKKKKKDPIAIKLKINLLSQLLYRNKTKYDVINYFLSFKPRVSSKWKV